MGMTGFICQDAYLAKTAKLSDAEFGKLIRALMIYHATGEETDLEGRESIAYDFIREDIDNAEKAYSQKCDQAKENRLKGGQRPSTAVDAGQRPSTPVDVGAQNKIELKENKIENKPKEREKEKEKESRSARFDLFWSIYPRKVGKEDARKAFDKLNPDDEMLDMILAAIGKQKVSSQWTENGGQFIPHPSTWLNGKRWNDDVVNYQSSKPPAPVKKTSQDYEQRDPVMADDAARQQFLAMLQGAGVT